MKINDFRIIINFQRTILVIFLMLSISSCQKLIEVDPPVESISSESTFNYVTTSVSVINSVYNRMQVYSLNTLQVGLLADELKPRIFPQFFAAYYTNDLQSETDSFTPQYWLASYATCIYNINLVIEGVNKSKGLSNRDKQILISEAKFTRAFLYFYLVNYYGDVPLVLTTDFKINSNIPRAPKEVVYNQITKDLEDAIVDLPLVYLSSDLATVTPDRVRPTKWAALSLLSRVYLFEGRWENAERLATQVIENTGMFHLESLENVFKKNNSETIWSLQPSFIQSADATNNTADAATYIPAPGQLPLRIISESLLDKFTNQDQRKTLWLGKIKDETVTPAVEYYYPYKYKYGANFTGFVQEQFEYLVVFRLAELYLIRAEARAQLNRIIGVNGAAQDLNIIRARAGLNETTADNKQDMLSAILNERQLEFFSEANHRWLDLKRTGLIDPIMEIETQKKGGKWEHYKALFPIPASEFINNPALRGHQNPGYRETQ